MYRKKLKSKEQTENKTTKPNELFETKTNVKRLIHFSVFAFEKIMNQVSENKTKKKRKTTDLQATTLKKISLELFCMYG